VFIGKFSDSFAVSSFSNPNLPVTLLIIAEIFLDHKLDDLIFFEIFANLNAFHAACSQIIHPITQIAEKTLSYQALLIL
jgi:hypothetical protein